MACRTHYSLIKPFPSRRSCRVSLSYSQYNGPDRVRFQPLSFPASVETAQRRSSQNTNAFSSATVRSAIAV